jgi:hypothetical protein
MQYYREELAAIVTKVHKSGLVNLAIFDPYGNSIQNPQQNVYFLESGVTSRVLNRDYCVCHPRNEILEPIPPDDPLDVPISPLSSITTPVPTQEQLIPEGLPAGAKLESIEPASPAQVEVAKAKARATGVRKKPLRNLVDKKKK